MIMALFRNQSFILTTNDSKQSRLHRLKNGAHQGSVLAPLFLHIYMYHLPSSIFRKFAYVDDLTRSTVKIHPGSHHVIIMCLIHQAPHGARGLTVLNEETQSLLASDSGSRAAWGSKRINHWHHSCLCLTWSGCPSKRRRRQSYLYFFPVIAYKKLS